MLSFKRFLESAPWKTASVRLGSKVFRIPFVEIQGNQPGKTMLITGGMDGDEYVGMEAVYSLYEKYMNGDFAGRLRLIPILNIPGFQAECSQNPLDQHFPKYFFPGRENGSPTEQLIAWFCREKLSEVDVWYDAHGGAITEGLNPFLWTFHTGSRDIDAFSEQFVGICGADLVMVESSGYGSKPYTLAKQGCHYVLGESGARGERKNEDVARHVHWIESLMRVHGMLEMTASSKKRPRIWSHVAFVYASHDGIWRPEANIGLEQKKGQVIGQSVKIDGSCLEDIQSSHNGIPLWWKETMAMRKGDILLAIGY